jgi:hypothetical protein
MIMSVLTCSFVKGFGAIMIEKGIFQLRTVKEGDVRSSKRGP